MATEWNINTDIYDILSTVKGVQRKYIEDEDETTLSLGVFGFIADTEAKKIQTATIMAGQLGNEMFPTRALLTKNVLTHAAYHGIEGINAKPAQITVSICIAIEDIEANINENNEFFLDSECPIFIGDYEFHLDYDIKIKRKPVGDGYSYSAQYIVNDEDGNKITNRLSDITNPYITQPYVVNISNKQHIGIQCTIRQCTIETIQDTMLSDSIIENKSYTFNFENQIADFVVQVTDDGEVTELTPYLYGSTTGEDDLYCWYLYTSDDTIRITFDSKSYIPGLSSDIYIKSFTTLGAEGNFDYLNIDNTSEGLYVSLESEKYNYSAIITYLVAVTDSTNGADRKTKEELQKLIPKAALGRGNITTETDVLNYFDMINTEDNRLIMQKKVDNQLSRVWYGYFLLKSMEKNIIPTNTVTLKVVLNSGFLNKCIDGRYILPAGSSIRLDPSNMIATPINEASVPSLYTNKYYYSGYFYYTTIYNIVLDLDPLYSSFYLTTCNDTSFFMYDYVNEDCDIQFIANRFNFKRNLMIDRDQYCLSFSIARSINDGSFVGILEEEVEMIDPQTEEPITETITTQNLRVVLVLYKDGDPYRWVECPLTENDEDNAIYTFTTYLATDNDYDDQNRIKIKNVNQVGTVKPLYGYFDANVTAEIYILAKIATDTTVDYARKDIDNIAPGYEDYTVTNIYSCAAGINLFVNYTNIINNKVTADESTDTTYYISGVPCVGAHYLISDVEATYLVEAMNERKAYIDYCLRLLENSMNVDFKFFNTYGPTLTYTLEDKETSVGYIDIVMKFKLSLKSNADYTVKDDIIAYIKNKIEDLNDTGDWHAPNLIRDVINDFEDRINFIEFVSFNSFDADDQHIIKKDIIDPTTVPEFINIRNFIDKETGKLSPAIDIEIV